LLKKDDAVAREYLRGVRLVGAIKLLELLRSPLFGGDAIFRSDLVWIDQLLRDAGLAAQN
jgi:hypothetical protein